METTTVTPFPREQDRRERNELVRRLQSSPVFRDYQRSFAAITGLPLALRAAGAFQLALQGNARANAFCTMLATRNRSCAACLAVQQRLEHAASERPGTVECFRGLHESAVPVRLGDHVIAYLHTGQVLYAPPSASRLREVAAELARQDPGADVAVLVRAYRQSRIVRKSQYNAVLRLLSYFARQLSSLINQIMVRERTAEPPVITRAREYIAGHFSNDLTLVQVARAVGLSRFYFCKSFRRRTGFTFTQYLSRVRVEAAKQILLNPHKRIGEAGYEAGFQSFSQFNRMFHRFAGQSPRAYRDRLQAATPRPHRLAVA